MLPAAYRFVLLAPWLAAGVCAADPAARVAPTRPMGSDPVAAAPGSFTAAAAPVPVKVTSLPSSRLGGVDYVSLRDAAELLGLKSSWAEKEHRLTLVDRAGKAEFEADSREVSMHGLRLFLGRPVLLRNGVLYASQIDFDRCLAPRLQPALLGKARLRPRVIALDPGHGGSDNGMENKRLGLKEKVLTLDVAQRLKKLLEARGYRVVLTREDDRQLGPDKATDFKKRAEIANRAGADLFVSIHFNSLYPDTKTSGTESYTFTRTFQRSDRASSPLEPDDTERQPASVNRFDPWSALLQQMIQREVIGSLRTLDRGQKTMHSAVLRELDCPAVLVESVFVSNENEAQRVATAAYRQQIAEAVAAGIQAYGDLLPPR